MNACLSADSSNMYAKYSYFSKYNIYCNDCFYHRLQMNLVCVINIIIVVKNKFNLLSTRCLQPIVKKVQLVVSGVFNAFAVYIDCKRIENERNNGFFFVCFYQLFVLGDLKKLCYSTNEAQNSRCYHSLDFICLFLPPVLVPTTN